MILTLSALMADCSGYSEIYHSFLDYLSSTPVASHLRILIERVDHRNQRASYDPIHDIRNEAKEQEILELVPTRAPHHEMSLISDRTHKPCRACDQNRHCKGNKTQLYTNETGWECRDLTLSSSANATAIGYMRAAAALLLINSVITRVIA
jgi:hypothetical protein